MAFVWHIFDWHSNRHFSNRKKRLSFWFKAFHGTQSIIYFFNFFLKVSHFHKIGNICVDFKTLLNFSATFDGNSKCLNHICLKVHSFKKEKSKKRIKMPRTKLNKKVANKRNRNSTADELRINAMGEVDRGDYSILKFKEKLN